MDTGSGYPRETGSLILTRVLGKLPLLNEAPERSETSARPHHDDGAAGAVREPEAGVADEDREGSHCWGAIVGAALLQPLHPGGGHALVCAASGCTILHQHSSDVHRIGVQLNREGKGRG